MSTPDPSPTTPSPEPLARHPVLAARDAVIFPGATVVVHVGRAKSLAALEAADRGDGRVLVLLQRENEEEIVPERLHTIGTVARLGERKRTPFGVRVTLEGERRAMAVRLVESANVLEALVRTAEDIPPLDAAEPAFVGMQREVRDRSIELAEKSGLPDELVRGVIESVGDDPGGLADVIAAHLDLDAAERQAVLETLSIEERLRRVLGHLLRQIELVDVQRDIRSRVKRDLGDRQREALLRAQLSAIQRELGEGEAEELDELRERIAALELPAPVRKEVDRDIARLGRLSRESMEFQVLRTSLETIAELPWNERSEERVDLERAAAVLDEDHHGLGDVKDRVLEFLAVLALRRARDEAEPGPENEPETEPVAQDATDGETASTAASRRARSAPILLFVGPPGVGKTSVARSIARALGREYGRIALGGARDEADIRGHRRTYVGAMPGRLITALRQAGTKNPVLLLDEVDKLGAGLQGDPAAALLEVLDPAQNHAFVDHYLGVPFDLSEVLFVATANLIQRIPAPLLDRMEVVEFRGYTEIEKREIARRYLLPRQLAESAIPEGRLSVTDAALERIISHYTRESGVRRLERQLAKLTRKIAREVAVDRASEDRALAVAIDVDDVRGYLGRPRVWPEKAATDDQVGVATGMYYTPAGGDIMFVEAITMPGNGRGELVLTGQLGDVMKESGRAVWSYARAHAGALLIEDEKFGRDVHIHVPAGAIPKDGPSAGVTMATAVVSALTGVPARRDVAMTGEITLTGRVLPIGGVKEKVLGAVRAGITTIVIPRPNEADLEDLPERVRDELVVHLVDELEEVLAVALRGGLVRPDEVTADR